MHDDLFNMIKKDHMEVKGMLSQIKEMGESDSATRGEMFTQLKKELVPHMKAEEKVFYPLLRKQKESKKDAMEAMEEHHIAEVSMMELDKMNVQEEFWPAKFSVFTELINHHIKEEEGKVFEDARRVMSEDEMNDVMKNFQQEKERIKGQTTTARS